MTFQYNIRKSTEFNRTYKTLFRKQCSNISIIHCRNSYHTNLMSDTNDVTKKQNVLGSDMVIDLKLLVRFGILWSPIYQNLQNCISLLFKIWRIDSCNQQLLIEPQTLKGIVIFHILQTKWITYQVLFVYPSCCQSTTASVLLHLWLQCCLLYLSPVKFHKVPFLPQNYTKCFQFGEFPLWQPTICSMVWILYHLVWYRHLN